LLRHGKDGGFGVKRTPFFPADTLRSGAEEAVEAAHATDLGAEARTGKRCWLEEVGEFKGMRLAVGGRGKSRETTTRPFPSLGFVG
jgi:hypothetical protein